VRRPSALLLDEPTNHLDDEAAAFLEERLRELPGTVRATHNRRSAAWRYTAGPFACPEAGTPLLTGLIGAAGQYGIKVRQPGHCPGHVPDRVRIL
ncbi:hypothetical protein, partial [Streptomyces albidoflavus]|uniref:hypothetical protein n=1 Tax=Streptomyces albidoflavus TaxID=1886 RepID=UPI0015CE677E